jgi:hypothetical protein
MIQQSKWLEREFQFNIEVGSYPCIIERLRGTPARLEDIINPLPQRILTLRENMSWSIQEHVGHLLDLGELDDRRLEDYRTSREMLSAWDIINRKTIEAEHNSKPIQDILTRFRKSRLDLVKKLEQFTEEEVSRSAIHPRLKRSMRVVDWCWFVAEHDDHHLARISELKRLFP